MSESRRSETRETGCDYDMRDTMLRFHRKLPGGARLYSMQSKRCRTGYRGAVIIGRCRYGLFFRYPLNYPKGYGWSFDTF